ncbi:interleukin enhancer-binding factor 2 homolog [Folsomia candida]|uniref:Interleukin enhancer binding factor n=1 Tax=Folsomia candida TaxID=158441 RepID=A0A226DMT2_FOLCA|nr:interleukin enhancer-binding factor 2 homolog [Folsomia candida]OXA46489.1 Interleukin enhancer-binding factor 2 [Folsomia candida]QBH73937.1 interleukin enhancer binding factor [Folsomia candida]
MRGGAIRGGRARRGRGSGGNMGAPMRGLGGGKLPFDLTFFDDIFPRVSPAPDDSELSNAILKRHTDISPSTEEIQSIQNMVTRVQGILENLILTPGAFDACQVDEVRQVGSFKQGTILAGHKTADFVVILKSLPTREAVDALCIRVSDDLRQSECVRSSVTDRGFDISSMQATVRIFITTIPPNFRKLDPEIHLDAKVMNEAWQAIRHSRWFEENAHNSTIKVLIRIFRDIRQRFTGIQTISTWMLDLLAHYATLNNPSRQALPVNMAFRRSLALMAAGMYLPGYSGASVRGHGMTYEQQDVATITAQTLVRILGHGGYKQVLGLETMYNDILTSSTVINNIVIKPLDKVYVPPAEGESDKLEDEEEEEEDHSSGMEPDMA